MAGAGSPQNPIRDAEVSFTALDAITQFAVVMLDPTTEGCKMPTGASVEKLGVAQAAADAGNQVTVLTDGIATCIAQAAVTAGAIVEVQGTTGKVVTKAKASAGAQPTPVVGQALQAAAADGDQIRVKLWPGGQY